MTESNEQVPGAEQETVVQNVRDLIERTFLLGVGAATMTKDRVQSLVQEFVERGQLSTEEGVRMVDRLIDRGREEALTMKKRAGSSLQGAYKDAGLASRVDLEDFEFRLRQLEHRVGLLEDASDEQEARADQGAGTVDS